MLKYPALLALTVSLFTACATEGSSRCEQAAAALAECTGAVPDGFVEACEANAEANGAAVVDSLLESSCEGVPTDGKADGFKEDAFVFACRAGIGAAYFTDWLRSPASKPLSKEFRDKLRPEYGALVDTVRVSWNARLVDKWSIGPINIHIGDIDVGAQTFGDEIFVSRPYDVNDKEMLVWLSHELQHARQAEQRGGLGGFETDYCRAFWDSSYSYRDNALEAEAYAQERALAACLRAGRSDCKRS